jgi:hypothetical protein
LQSGSFGAVLHLSLFHIFSHIDISEGGIWFNPLKKTYLIEERVQIGSIFWIYLHG